MSVEFWSSIELGAFARGLMRELQAGGLDVRHRFEVTESEYRGANSALSRGHVRWRSYLSYPWNLYRQLRSGPAPEAVVVCTNTFYAPAVALKAAASRHIPVVNWIFDLFPDVLVSGRKIRNGGAWERRLGRLARDIFQRSAANVFLGERLRLYAESRYGEIPRSLVIPVGADGAAFPVLPPEPREPLRPVRVLYCGNLGRMHETETISEIMREPGPPGWTIEFRGHGAGFRELSAPGRSSGLGDRVVFGASLADSEWAKTMHAADIALVTLKSGAEGLVMPSKTYSAMMAGQAVLAICPLASDLADTILRDDAGWVVEPGDREGLAAALAGAVARPDELLAKRRNAFRAGHERYDERALAPQWVDLLQSLERR